jgi:hypothetical protein
MNFVVVKENMVRGDLSIPYFFYVLTNILPVILGSLLVTYVEPVAAGSGEYCLETLNFLRDAKLYLIF